jgi:hypothetical protein
MEAAQTKIKSELATIGGELTSNAAQGEISTPPRSRTSSPWWGGSSPPLYYGFVEVAWCISLLIFIVLDPYELPIMIVDIFVILFVVDLFSMSWYLRFESSFVYDVLVDTYVDTILKYLSWSHLYGWNYMGDVCIRWSNMGVVIG